MFLHIQAQATGERFVYLYIFLIPFFFLQGKFIGKLFIYLRDGDL